ncbi:alpha/beta hydrolase [Paraburkholderia phymatum]|uniref:Alpha/beta hydrolase fold-3 domain protein n=1 Tax=Paraburkholderia phymatum (strain DSM 17167 / CIP 108236 / LMG 21445 / STM815) TaxID=391038 RepID=B2JS61_PARP8|nr:alpha/beta hydrolase [Paraburkholderia phymatum]ACC72438.1 Alpha/beta hydrolase fold-3 domain protein [Paraburkholderia phymatum STM815]
MLEPEIVEFVERTKRLYPADRSASTPAEQRAMYERLAAAFTPPLPDGVTTQDALFMPPASGQSFMLRLYVPTDRARASGTVLYFHGGGFVVGSLASHELITARIAADTGLCVVAVDYRLAPEHPAPAAHDDCLAVTRAALDGSLPFSALPRSLQLAGDSAGGTLAASVALRLRDEGVPGVRGLALVYPMLGIEPQLPARDTEADAPMLTLADVRRYGELYWRGRPVDTWTVPLEASRYDGLPPTLAIGVEHDPLRDDARVFAERIVAARGRVDAPIGRGLVHGAWRALATSPGVQWMHREVCRFLSAHAAD